MYRHVLMAELENIARNQLLAPGDTLSHASAKECVEHGWAKRTDGGFFMTRAGYRAIESPRWWVEKRFRSARMAYRELVSDIEDWYDS